jgi:hypothetical protein
MRLPIPRALVPRFSALFGELTTKAAAGALDAAKRSGKSLKVGRWAAFLNLRQSTFGKRGAYIKLDTACEEGARLSIKVDQAAWAPFHGALKMALEIPF